MARPGVVPVHELEIDPKGRVYFMMKLVQDDRRPLPRTRHLCLALGCAVRTLLHRAGKPDVGGLDLQALSGLRDRASGVDVWFGFRDVVGRRLCFVVHFDIAREAIDGELPAFDRVQHCAVRLVGVSAVREVA